MNNTLNKIYKNGGYHQVGKNKSRIITVHSGKNKFNRSVGDECTFQIRDILLNIKYIDFNNFDKNNNEFLSSIASMFKLQYNSYEILLKEITYLLSISNKELAQIYVNKFRIYSVFSDVMRPLFMKIREYFENQIKILCKYMSIDINVYIKKWNEYDKQHNINSSSIILYQLGKDKNFLNTLQSTNEQQKTRDLISKLINYVSDINKWNYKGYCPYEPVKRTKLLLAFPLYMIFDILISINETKYVTKQLNMISKLKLNDVKIISPPYKIIHTVDTLNTNKTINNRPHDVEIKEFKKLIKKLICKLHDTKSILESWEEYYIETSRIFSELCNRLEIILI